MNRLAGIISISLLVVGCQKKENPYDATGTFETDEVIISAQQSGEILELNINEGQNIAQNAVIGKIDVSNLQLQKQQKEASLKALSQKTYDANPQLELVRKQLAVQQSQLAQQIHEQKRLVNLVRAEGATQKQLDDANAGIDQTRKQIAATEQQLNLYQSNIETQNRSILSESDPAAKSVAIVDDQIRKGTIINPIGGTILTQYAFAGEYSTTGKALYKIADISTLNLRAYITESQLSKIKLGQKVSVLIAQGEGKTKKYEGIISWISNKAEFTPKTIQTQDERANLVYAIKIKVKNDGYLKIGMYADVKF